MNLPISRFFRYLFVAIMMLSGCYASSQSIQTNLSDSLKQKSIKLSEIPIESAETLMKTNKILDRLISNDEIIRLKNSNDSILDLVEQETSLFQQNIDVHSIRLLKNRILQLSAQKSIVEDEMTSLTEVFESLSKSIIYFNQEKKIWQKTKIEINKSDHLEKIADHIDYIILSVDSALMSVSKRAEFMLFTLDRSSRVSVEIDELLEDLDNQLLKLEMQLLQSNYPTILKLDYTFEDAKFGKSLVSHFKSEWFELKSYLISKNNQLVMLGLMFVLLLWLFFNFKNVFRDNTVDPDNYYKKRLNQILTRPISAAFIITVIISSIVLPNRPMAYNDFSIYIVIVPFVLIINKLFNKDILTLIYGFSALMLFEIIFEILPPENIIFRLLLLLIAMIEVFLTGYFLYRIFKTLNFSKNNPMLSKTIAYLFFIAACVGLFEAILGNVILALKIFSTINTAVLVGALLHASLIILNGLLVMLIDSKASSKITFFRSHQSIIKRRTYKLLRGLAIFYFFVLLMMNINIWKLASQGFFEFFTQEMNLGKVTFSFGSIFVFFIVIYLSIVISNILQVILEGGVLKKMSLAKGMPHTISMMVKYSLITIGIFLAVSAAGIPFNNLTVIIGALGVGIGFGLQNIFNNLVSGLILLFERPVQIGDTVEVGTLIGTVKSIGIRSSNVQTFDGAEVIVPNGQLISNEVINWTLSNQQRRIEIIVGVSYNSDTHLVHKLLLQILNEHKEIMQNPKPVVLFKELGESSLDFRMLFWTASFGDWLRIRSEVIFRVFDVLKENNIEIPFPQRDLHVRSIEQHLKVDKFKD